MLNRYFWSCSRSPIGFHTGSGNLYILNGAFHAGTDSSDFRAGIDATASVTGRLPMAPIDPDNDVLSVTFSPEG
jgi:hypothetical protein